MKELVPEIIIYDANGNEYHTTLVTERSMRKVVLMGEDYITLEFSHDKPLRFNRGYYCDIVYEDFEYDKDGKKEVIQTVSHRYIVCEPCYPTYNKSTGGYDYSLRLDSWIYSWKRYQFALVAAVGSVETSFSFTDRLEGHVKLLLELLNYKSGADPSIVFPDIIAIHYIQYDDTEESDTAYIWTVYLDGKTGEVVSTEQDGSIGLYSNESSKYVEYRVQYINYSNRNVIEAINDLCGESGFNCEWWVEETEDGTTLHFGRCEHGDEIELKRGEQISDMQRQQSSDEYATRLIAFGSTTNVPARYHDLLKCEVDELFTEKELGIDTLLANKTNYNALRTTDIEINNYDGTDGSGYDSMKRIVADRDIIIFDDVDFDLGIVGGEGTLDERLHQFSCFVSYELENAIANTFICALYRRWYDNGVLIEEKISETEVIDIRQNVIHKLETEPFHASPKYQDTYFVRVTGSTEGDTEMDRKVTIHIFGTLHKMTNTFMSQRDFMYFRDSTRPLKPSHFRYSNLKYSTANDYTFRVRKSDCYGGDMLFASNYEAKYVGLMKAGKIGITADFSQSTCESVTIFLVACTEFGNINSSVGEIHAGTYYRSDTEHEEKEMIFLPQNLESLESDYFLYVKIQPNNSGNGKIEVDGDVSIRLMNPSYSTTVNVIDNKNAVVSTVNVVINPYFYYEGSTGVNSRDDGSRLASLFRYSNERIIGTEKNKVSLEDKFVPQEIDEVEINGGWFTPLFDGYKFTASSEKRLMLPVSSCPYNYIDSSNTQGGTNIVELVKVFDDIYPSMNVRIVKVGTYAETIHEDDGDKIVPRYYFCLRKEDVNFSDRYISPQKNLQCQFLPKVAHAIGEDVEEGETVGTLAGFTFDLKFAGTYSEDKTLQRYNIITNKDYGVDMPNETLAPAVGDKIVLLNYLSDRIQEMNLVEKAEQRLYKRATSYLERICYDRGTYNATLFAKYAQTLFDSLSGLPRLGHRIKVTDDTYFDYPRSTRVIGIEHKLDIPYDNPILILGEAEAYSRFKSIENKIR